MKSKKPEASWGGAGGLPEPGAIVDGRHRVTGVLGAGGMGFVVDAVELDSGTRVAVKVLRGELRDDPVVVARFLREAMTAGQIESPHVVCVRGAGTCPTHGPYLAMELLTGRDLRELLDVGTHFPVEEAVGLALQVALGLAAAHYQGIVHRDIKPENIFLEVVAGRTVVKVVDFGVSKVGLEPDGALTGTAGPSLGSPHYMAPEQVRDVKDVDERADIWSLGTVLYETLTGQAAFDGPAASKVLLSVVEDEPAPLAEHRRGVPPGLEELVLRCLAKDREARPATALDLAEALLPFAARDEARLGRAAIDILRKGLVLDRPVSSLAGAAISAPAAYRDPRYAPGSDSADGVSAGPPSWQTQVLAAFLLASIVAAYLTIRATSPSPSQSAPTLAGAHEGPSLAATPSASASAAMAPPAISVSTAMAPARASGSAAPASSDDDDL